MAMLPLAINRRWQETRKLMEQLITGTLSSFTTITRSLDKASSKPTEVHEGFSQEAELTLLEKLRRVVEEGMAIEEDTSWIVDALRHMAQEKGVLDDPAVGSSLASLQELESPAEQTVEEEPTNLGLEVAISSSDTQGLTEAIMSSASEMVNSLFQETWRKDDELRRQLASALRALVNSAVATLGENYNERLRQADEFARSPANLSQALATLHDPAQTICRPLIPQIPDFMEEEAWLAALPPEPAAHMESLLSEAFVIAENFERELLRQFFEEVETMMKRLERHASTALSLAVEAAHRNRHWLAKTTDTEDGGSLPPSG